jgi:two-component system chemotaxis response regulator CheB
MAIKRLLGEVQEDVSFLLKKGEALLLFDFQGETECLYCINPTEEDFNKLLSYKDAKNIRFLGDERIYVDIVRKNIWVAFSKAMLNHENLPVVCYGKSRKLRFNRMASKVTEFKPKKVLIIDDSTTIQKILKKIVGQSYLLEVLDVASCPSEAEKIIIKEQPDLITLDIHMPEMNGVEFLKTFLNSYDIPTIMISSISMNEGPLVMEALASGAQTYIQKPSLDQMQEKTQEIIKELESMAFLRTKKSASAPRQRINGSFDTLDGLIAIGSSTGGTKALEDIFLSLPDEIPPTVVVQHIPAVFSKALAERLNNYCTFTIKEAEDGDTLEVNTVYIAPGGQQMAIKGTKNKKVIEINDDAPVNRFKPSVDYMFNTLAQFQNHENTLGIILTGMGKDGADGLLKLKELGAMTFAQDETTSVVYGMPRKAVELGAVQKELPLQEIGQNIVLHFNSLQKKKSA